jgi:hypothetical protein
MESVPLFFVYKISINFEINILVSSIHKRLCSSHVFSRVLVAAILNFYFIFEIQFYFQGTGTLPFEIYTLIKTPILD